MLRQASTESRKSRCEEVEVQNTGAATANAEESAKSEFLSNNELQQQMEQLGEELEKRKASKLKYKTLLQEEKEKTAMLQTHYLQELAKNEKQMDELKAEWQKKVDVLQQRNAILQVS